MLSNVRGEPSYMAGMPNAQAHTPRPETKMPPMGNFAPPPSVGKENKKRRGGAGTQITVGASVSAGVDAGPISVSSRNAVQGGNAAKVSPSSSTSLFQSDRSLIAASMFSHISLVVLFFMHTSNVEYSSMCRR